MTVPNVNSTATPAVQQTNASKEPVKSAPQDNLANSSIANANAAKEQANEPGFISRFLGGIVSFLKKGFDLVIWFITCCPPNSPAKAPEKKSDTKPSGGGQSAATTSTAAKPEENQANGSTAAAASQSPSKANPATDNPLTSKIPDQDLPVADQQKPPVDANPQNPPAVDQQKPPAVDSKDSPAANQQQPPVAADPKAPPVVQQLPETPKLNPNEQAAKHFVDLLQTEDAKIVATYTELNETAFSWDMFDKMMSTLTHLFGFFRKTDTPSKEFPLFLALLKEETALLTQVAKESCAEVASKLEGEKEETKLLRDFFGTHLPALLEKATKEEIKAFLNLCYDCENLDALKNSLNQLGSKHITEKQAFQDNVNSLFKDDGQAFKRLAHATLSDSMLGLSIPIDLKLIFCQHLLKLTPEKTIKTAASFFKDSIPMLKALGDHIATLEPEGRDAIADNLGKGVENMNTLHAFKTVETEKV